jgi:hypothetical protein
VKLYLKKILHKNRAGGVAQGAGLEFKPQYHTHTHKQIKYTNDYCFLLFPFKLLSFSFLVGNLVLNVKVLGLNHVIWKQPR